jgi:hypothetical protein
MKKRNKIKYHAKTIIYLLIFIVSSRNPLFSQTVSNMIFKSSFNNIIVDKTVSWNHHLQGTDSETGYTFPDDLPGDTSEHFFNYVIGDTENYFEYANAEIVTTLGYDENLTNALYIEYIRDDSTFISQSRVQYAMYGSADSNDPVQRLNQGYVKYRMKKFFDHNDIESGDWSLPFELKDVDDDGFRVGLYIYGTTTATPYWVAKGQYMIDGELGANVWQVDNYDIPVPENEWFNLEVFWYGNQDSNLGKFKVAINNQVVFDITNQTKDPNHPNKMFYFMPFKVYGTVGHSWITDFEYWDNPPSNSVISTNVTVSINDYLDSSNFNIYPNPSNNIINISSSLLNLNYELFTITGDIIKKGVIENQKIEVSEIDNGIYFLKINQRSSNTTKIVKFIKR